MVGLISGHGEQVLVMGWILLENIFLGVVRCGRFGGFVIIFVIDKMNCICIIARRSWNATTTNTNLPF